MRVLVLYGSRLGATRGIAERIGARLCASGADAVVRPAADAGELVGWDAFVIGSGVYAGHWVKAAAEFVRRHRAVVSSHPVWLFSSGPVGKLANGHPPVEPKEMPELCRIANPRDHQIFWGALDRKVVDGSDLGFTERVVARTLIPEGDFRDWTAIESWADQIGRDLQTLAATARH